MGVECASCRIKCIDIYSGKNISTQHISKEPEETYGGMRYTADSADCAMPISMDSHSSCSFVCLYCFSNNLQRSIQRNMKKKRNIEEFGTLYRHHSLRKLERFLSGKGTSKFDRSAYKLISVGQPIQWGALGDPFDDVEAVTGWGLGAIKIFRKYKIPVRISTKGAKTLLKKEYVRAFSNVDHFWFAFSIITANDALIEKIDLGAPNATERLKAMKVYTKEGHSASLRLRPFLLGISDAWKGEPEGWKVLLDKAANSGARAVSFEWAFWNNAPTACQLVQYKMLNKIQGNKNYYTEWKLNSSGGESCLRGAKDLKEDLTFRIREHTHKLGMDFCCSDPHFKEYGDFGNCCGMPPDDPIWGGWDKKQLCEIVVRGRKHFEKTGNCLKFYYKDVDAEWSKRVSRSELVATAGWRDYRKRKNETWNNTLHNKWNDSNHPRSPFVYFKGILVPVGIDGNGDIIYQYKPYKNWKLWKEKL